MRKYKVKSLAVSGKNNKIYRPGDEVTDKHFPDGNAIQLCKGGHLELVEGEISDSVNEEESVEMTDHTDDTKSKTDPPTEDEIIPYDDVTKEEMITRLMNKQVNFNPELGKKKMYALYEKTFEAEK